MNREELRRHNLRAAGMRPGCLLYALMALLVSAVLAVPYLLMMALLWLIGGRP